MTYTTPIHTDPTSHSSYPSMPSNPLPAHNPPAEALVSTSSPPVWPHGIHVVNPAENQVSIGFAIDGEPYTLRPGQRLEFAQNAARAIQFDRGGQFGNGIYRLDSTVFTFTPTPRGWDLYQTPHREAALTSSPTAIQVPPPIPWPAR